MDKDKLVDYDDDDDILSSAHGLLLLYYFGSKLLVFKYVHQLSTCRTFYLMNKTFQSRMMIGTHVKVEV